jgi:hypothetical protein
MYLYCSVMIRFANPEPVVIKESGTYSHKKDDEPLLSLTGAFEQLLKREGTFVYTK